MSPRPPLTRDKLSHCSAPFRGSQAGPGGGGRDCTLGLSSPGPTLPFVCDLVSQGVPVGFLRILQVSTQASGLIQAQRVTFDAHRQEACWASRAPALALVGTDLQLTAAQASGLGVQTGKGPRGLEPQRSQPQGTGSSRSWSAGVRGPRADRGPWTLSWATSCVCSFVTPSVLSDRAEGSKGHRKPRSLGRDLGGLGGQAHCSRAHRWHRSPVWLNFQNYGLNSRTLGFGLRAQPSSCPLPLHLRDRDCCPLAGPRGPPLPGGQGTRTEHVQDGAVPRFSAGRLCEREDGGRPT